MSRLSLAYDTDDLAHHYDEVSADRQFRFGKTLVETLGITTGDRVLDIGSGTGLLARHVAELVGPTGFVAGIDPLPLRIAIARQKAQPNLRFEVGNAYDLSDFDNASFDVVYLNAVFHWLPEKLPPLQQIARVLKPGGRLGIATGSREHRNQLQAVKARVLARAPFNQYAESSDGVPHHVSADELEALLRTTGFAVRSIDVVPTSHYLPTGDATIRFSEASSFGNFLGHLPEGVRAQAREQIEEELDKLRTDAGIPLGGARLVAIATRLAPSP
jgi:ubiquinone/menaquinone biosynthesis C-methylase UbiE